ncbi:hypothetical protein EYC84_003689 [Monilinia fructicola]|uniref:Uncharacterized protein n=1 Tax=Monilinia fructicola TaxID=38448 RepID=A0A5M9JX14_MONFR|nr:hypothetical protein EYC84_003689 [Monilinia fructicola]
MSRFEDSNRYNLTALRLAPDKDHDDVQVDGPKKSWKAAICSAEPRRCSLYTPQYGLSSSIILSIPTISILSFAAAYVHKYNLGSHTSPRPSSLIPHPSSLTIMDISIGREKKAKKKGLDHTLFSWTRY